MEEQKNIQEQLEETEAVSEEIREETPVAEEPVSETAAEAAEETVKEVPAKKATHGKIALAVAAVVVLAAALIALIVSGQNKEAAQVPAETVQTVEATVPADGNPDDVTCKGSYSVSDEEAIAAGDTVVATIGEYQLTNSQLQVYHRKEFQNFPNQYGA